jgi:VCBS repeat-containing protein
MLRAALAMPLVADDRYQTGKDREFSASAPGVLSNDQHVNGSRLMAQKTLDPQHGALVLNDDGSFRYVPANGFVGTDAFRYTASDGRLEAARSASVTITVSAP